MKKTFKHIVLDELYRLRHEAIFRARQSQSGPLTEEDTEGPGPVGMIGEVDRSIATIIETRI